jgi:hypothetical protein
MMTLRCVAILLLLAGQEELQPGAKHVDKALGFEVTLFKGTVEITFWLDPEARKKCRKEIKTK